MKFYIPVLSLFLINSVASEICYAGGMKDHPISPNTEQPPCWYKLKDGSYSCFDLVNGSCPFPGNIKHRLAAANPVAVKPESVKPVAAKPEALKPEAIKPEAIKPESVNPESINPATLKLAATKKKPIVCYRGNMKDHPTSGPHSPPCWYREPNGAFSCYELDPRTHKCPDFPNRVKRPQ